MLAAMFSGKFEMKPSEDGCFFIDRDGTYFRFVLNYLRNGELILPDGATFLKELETEANFYHLRGILDELQSKKPKVFEETVILRNEGHRRVLKSWFPEAMKANGFTRWLCCFKVSFQMRQQRTNNHCCKKWWKHFWRLYWESLDK